MGEADSFVKFSCENCGYKSTISESYAGKNIRCPNCYIIIFIPKPDTTSTKQSSSKYSAYDSSLLNVQEQNILKHQQKREYVETELAYEAEEEDEEEPLKEIPPAAQRKAPWFIDIFLYPFNWPGLKHLALFILVPQLINSIESILPYLIGFVFSVFGFIFKILIMLYIYWYLAECVRESAGGWVRAPQGFGGLPTLRDMFGQLVNIFGCLAVFFAPFVLYVWITRKTGIIFWLLLISGVSLYPMALLFVLMHESGRDLNLHKFAKSISNTYFPYCCLVLFFVLTALLISLIPLEMTRSPFWNCVFRAVIIYTALIGAHLLGRFYWRYQDKLNWDL